MEVLLHLAGNKCGLIIKFWTLEGVVRETIRNEREMNLKQRETSVNNQKDTSTTINIEFFCWTFTCAAVLLGLCCPARIVYCEVQEVEKIKFDNRTLIWKYFAFGRK